MTRKLLLVALGLALAVLVSLSFALPNKPSLEAQQRRWLGSQRAEGWWEFFRDRLGW